MHPSPRHTHQSHCCNPIHRRETEEEGSTVKACLVLRQSLPMSPKLALMELMIFLLIARVLGSATHRQVILGCIGRQAEQAMGNKSAWQVYTTMPDWLKSTLWTVHQPDKKLQPEQLWSRVLSTPQSSSELKSLGPRSAKQQIQGWRGRLGSHEAGRQTRWRRRLLPKSSCAGPTGLTHFGWVATFLSNELFNCLIYLSRLGSADILCCLLIAWKVEQFFMF